MQSRNPNNLKGIDISHYEFEGGNSVDFDDVVAQGIKVVYTKATDGSYGDSIHDPYLSLVVTECQKRNLAVGGYHFFRVWKNSTVDAQVNNFVNYIKGFTFTLPPVLDVEYETICDGADSATVLAQTNEFIAKAEAILGVKMMVYINTGLLKELPALPSANKFWIADYNDYGAPFANGKIDSWTGYQYSDKGILKGVNVVDVNEFTSDVIVPSWCYGSQPVSQPIAQPTPVSNPVSQVILSGVELQSDLNKIGNYGLVLDGVIGDNSKAAIRDFQGKYGLQVDGDCGVNTSAKIIEVLNSIPVAPVNNGDPTIRDIQNKLNRLHITDSNGNSLVSDGISGACTVSAITKFQTICGISADGIWGSQSESAYEQIVAKPTIQMGVNGLVTRYVQFMVGTDYDGIFGNGTASCVANWQSRHGLSADSIVGSMSWSVLIG